MKKLYISDLDGTLLNDNAAFSEYTKEKLNYFYEKGVTVSLATARSIMSARPIIGEVKFGAPVVLMNGVFVYDLEKDRAVKYFELPAEAMAQALDSFYKRGLNPFLYLYGDDGSLSMRYSGFDSEGMRRFYETRKVMLGGRFTYSADFTRPEKGQHPVYVNYYAPYEIVSPVAKEIEKIKGVSFVFYKDSYSEDWLIEIYSAQASKARGVEYIKNYCKADSVTAFGDNLNDILMLESADRAVAVENAVPKVKEIADEIIGSNNSDSVIKFIESDYMKGQ